MKDPILIYRTATINDINEVVTLHKETFHNNFTTTLGSRFLKRYYRLFMNQGFYFLVATKEEKVVGFIVGVNNYKLLSKHLKNNALLFLPTVISSIGNYKLFPFILKTAYSFIFKGRANNIPHDLTYYNEITSFAVKNNSRGLGIGGILLEKYISKIHDSDVSGVFVTTDANYNKATINFYTKQGFDVKYSYMQSKSRKMHLMLKDFSE